MDFISLLYTPWLCVALRCDKSTQQQTLATPSPSFSTIRHRSTILATPSPTPRVRRDLHLSYSPHPHPPSPPRIQEEGNIQRPSNLKIEAIGRMDPESKDPCDFDSTVRLNEISYEEGYNDGFNDGLVPGMEEGREVGLKNGFVVGEELGFYQGCVNVWESVINVAPGVYSSRLQKSITQLRELVEKYPLLEPENDHVQEMMDVIRLKFRIISANLGVKLEYSGYPKSSKHDVEDIQS